MFFRRFFCFFIAGLFCLLPLCEAEEANGNLMVMAGFDNTQYRNWNENLFFKRMEEITGVSFQYRQYKEEKEWTQAKQQMTADSSDLPDVLFKASLSTEECIEMREKGVLIDLKPYLAENCPHLWAYLTENPDMLSALTMPDGSIAALPYISQPATQNYIWINQEWLDTLRLERPATAAELVTVMEAFKTRDPNRNGREDEIPMGFLGPFDLKFLAHAFGLIANDYNIFVDNGQVKFMPLEENFRLFIAWCHDLYAARLLDHNGFQLSDEMRTVTDSNAKPTYGMIITPMAADLFKVSWAQNYQILMPLSYEGEQKYRSFTGPLLRGTFAVTSACSDPAKALQWVDYLYTEEGAALSSIGKENVDYLVDGDGTWRFVDTIQNQYEFFRGETLMDGGTMHPGMLATAFQKQMSGGEMVKQVLEAQEQFDQYAVMPFPYYSLNREQLEKVTALQKQIGYEVDMQIARWVLGEEELTDESFGAFREEMNRLGLNEFLQFWQDVYNQTEGGKQP